MPILQQPSCPSCCDGIISVEATGGTNVTFSIDGGNTWFPPSVFGGNHRVFEGLCEGVYNAAVKYFNGGRWCTISTSYLLTNRCSDPCSDEFEGCCNQYISRSRTGKLEDGVVEEILSNDALFTFVGYSNPDVPIEEAACCDGAPNEVTIALTAIRDLTNNVFIPFNPATYIINAEPPGPVTFTPPIAVINTIYIPEIDGPEFEILNIELLFTVTYCGISLPPNFFSVSIPSNCCQNSYGAFAGTGFLNPLETDEGLISPTDTVLASFTAFCCPDITDDNPISVTLTTIHNITTNADVPFNPATVEINGNPPSATITGDTVLNISSILIPELTDSFRCDVIQLYFTVELCGETYGFEGPSDDIGYWVTIIPNDLCQCCDDVDIVVNGATFNYSLARIDEEILQINSNPILTITPTCCNGDNTVVIPEQQVTYIDNNFQESPIIIVVPSTFVDATVGGTYELYSISDVIRKIQVINYEEDCIDPDTGLPNNTGYLSQGGYVDIIALICGVPKTIRIPVLPRTECCPPCEETLLVINDSTDGFGANLDQALRFFPTVNPNTLNNTIAPESGVVVNNQLIAYIPIKATCGCEINLTSGDCQVDSIYYDSFGGNIIGVQDVSGIPTVNESTSCQTGFTVDSIVFEPEIPSVQEARFVIRGTKTGRSSGQVTFSIVNDCGDGNFVTVYAYRYFGEAEPLVTVGGAEGTSGAAYHNYISSAYFEPVVVAAPIAFALPFYTFGQPNYPEVTDYIPATPSTYLGQAQSPTALNNRVFNYTLPITMTVNRNCATYPVVEVFPEKLVRHDLLLGITRPDIATYARCFEQYCFYQFSGDVTNSFRPYAAGAGAHKDLTAFIEERGLISFDIDEFSKAITFDFNFGSYRPLGIQTTESRWNVGIIANPGPQQYHLYLRLRYYPLEYYNVPNNALARTRHYDQMVVVSFSVDDSGPL